MIPAQWLLGVSTSPKIFAIKASNFAMSTSNKSTSNKSTSNKEVISAG
jgi:hypothetical protein